ncbi:MAG: tripartite tricarboxylate transporter substrate binding protein BugD [Xanthobacteraceae bacterium]|nr:tripartite tricarboxylate transporter substrate binding protein BugD [Xanthobacteraceae bacterium]
MRLLFALIASLAAATGAAAQTYPNKSITIIVPFAAGGPSDALARIMGEHMKGTLGQSFVVENVTGAAGSIAVGRAVRSAPDGYTISFGHLGTHVANGAIYTLPYDLLADLEPVVLLPSNPMVVVSKNALPAKTLKELLAWLKANQDKATAGTAGAGSGSHLAGVYLQSLTGLKLQYVPYRGTAPALTDLVGGQIDIIVDQASNSMQQIRSGGIRAYAITDTKRLKAAPEIPTAEEAGLPGFHMTLWNGLWAPKGTPKDAIARLNTAAVAAMADPAVQKRLNDLGLEVPAREQQTPQALGVWHKAEIDKWWPIVKKAGIKPE